MTKIWLHGVLFVIFVAILGCGQKDENKSQAEKSKVEEAVKEAVTKEFKLYQGAKAGIEKVEKEAQERREKEKEVK